MRLMSPASRTFQRHALAAHAVLGRGSDDDGLDGLRPVVHDSWLRSLGFLPDPDRIEPVAGLGAAELDAYRSAHPLAGIMPVIDRLLVRPARDPYRRVRGGMLPERWTRPLDERGRDDEPQRAPDALPQTGRSA